MARKARSLWWCQSPAAMSIPSLLWREVFVSYQSPGPMPHSGRLRECSVLPMQPQEARQRVFGHPARKHSEINSKTLTEAGRKIKMWVPYCVCHVVCVVLCVSYCVCHIVLLPSVAFPFLWLFGQHPKTALGLTSLNS